MVGLINKRMDYQTAICVCLFVYVYVQCVELKPQTEHVLFWH